MTERATLADSRRLTGPNRLFDGPGAVVDVLLPPATAERVVAEWQAAIRQALDGVGWGDAAIAVLRWEGGASLGHTAPVDALYSATDVNEWAFAWAAGVVEGPPGEPAELAIPRLRARIATERNGRLVTLEAAAVEHGAAFLADNQVVTVGSGAGGATFPVRALPLPESLDWGVVHDVPTVLVTGSNGKTTTTRLLAAMAADAGRVTGLSSTDGVTVAGEAIAAGDYSGPEGARLVLRDRRTEVAILETARGGILRRGLAVRRADVAVITNIAADHFGEFGVHDLASLTETKFVVAKAIGRGGWLVLNADDPALVARARQASVPVAWFSLEARHPLVQAAFAAGAPVAQLEDDVLRLRRGAERIDLLPAADVPLAMGGSARYNVANALAASLAAWCLGLPVDAIRSALARFGRANADNPGRANRYALGGVQVLLDYAHNPHGLDALVAMARALPANRRLVVLGQAGDRDDEAIRGLARSAWPLAPDRVILKEMAAYRRGRAEGEIPGLIADEFAALGLAPQAVEVAPSELAAVEHALGWAQAGDLLVLTVHAERPAVLELLDRLERSGWRPGTPI